MNFRPSEPIPGAFEPRHGHSPAQPLVATAVLVTPRAADLSVYDRERLQRELEGGGAPSERIGAGHRTIFARFFDFLVR